MKIKVGDTVVVVSGSRKDKKKTGKVLSIIKDKDLVVVEGINLKKKLLRDVNGNKEYKEMEYPVHVSNVMIYDSETKKGTRVGFEGSGREKKRIAKVSGKAIK